MSKSNPSVTKDIIWRMSMIKKLRLRFILAALGAILFVLSATIGAINTYNYVKIENEAQASLTMVIDQGVQESPGEPGRGGPDKPNDNIVREHYFIVTFDNNGSITNSNFKHIFSINEEDGKELAATIYSKQSNKGSTGNFRYQKKENNEGVYIAFIDIKEKMDNFNAFLVSSITISLISYAILAGLIVLAAHFVFKTSEESYKKQKAFITNASHELKTPLTIINTDLEIVEMDNGQNEWTDSIRDQVNRLTTMTNQLVTLSKLEENDLSQYPFENFSLSNIANECVESFQATFKKKELLLNAQVKEDVQMHGNKYLINELFYIFLDNALKYTKEKGNVDLEVRNNKNRTELLFSNDVEEDQEIDPKQLFERFYRSPNSNKKEGSGIGLSIAKEIIGLHKGKVNVSLSNNRINFLITF